LLQNDFIAYEGVYFKLIGVYKYTYWYHEIDSWDRTLFQQVYYDDLKLSTRLDSNVLSDAIASIDKFFNNKIVLCPTIIEYIDEQPQFYTGKTNNEWKI
jgi:hypothetical protein